MPGSLELRFPAEWLLVCCLYLSDGELLQISLVSRLLLEHADQANRLVAAARLYLENLPTVCLPPLPSYSTMVRKVQDQLHTLQTLARHWSMSEDGADVRVFLHRLVTHSYTDNVGWIWSIHGGITWVQYSLDGALATELAVLYKEEGEEDEGAQNEFLICFRALTVPGEIQQHIPRSYAI